MKKLSKTQQAMLQRLATVGASGERTPMTGNRESGRICSAWYRTANSLQQLGLIKMRRSGDAYKAFLPEFAPQIEQ